MAAALECFHELAAHGLLRGVARAGEWGLSDLKGGRARVGEGFTSKGERAL